MVRFRDLPLKLSKKALAKVRQVPDPTATPERQDDEGPEYWRGYQDGIGAKHKVSMENMARMGNVWLEAAQEKLGHGASCLCHTCATARKMTRLMVLNQIAKKGDVR